MMDRERFEVLVGSMVFGLTREGTVAEVDEVIRRWDDCKMYLSKARAVLAAMDAAVEDMKTGNFETAERLLDERAQGWRSAN